MPWQWPWTPTPKATPPAPTPQEQAPDPAIRAEIKELRAEVHEAVTAFEQGFNALVSEVQEFAGDLDRFEKDLEEGLEVARRRENRIRASVSRALDQLEEDGDLTPAFAAEVAELRRGDGEAGGEEGVPAVHEEVGWDAPSSVPGVTIGQLRQARMM